MAPDQRYCIACGERRTGGGLRDALPRTVVAAPAATAGGRRVQMSPNTSFIAGIGCLLLALGVGVLIGRSGDNSGSAKSSAPQVVTVQTSGSGGGTAATAAGTAAAAKTASAAKKHKAKSHATKAATNTDVQKTAAKNGVKLPPPTVKVGGKCQKGAKGCQGGKFTGNFFGGG